MIIMNSLTLARLKFSAILLLALSASCFAQKKSLGIDDYGRFRSISSVRISDSGRLVSYSYQTPRKDDTLYIANPEGTILHIIPCGSDLKFSDDEKWAAYKLSETFKKQESLKKAGKPVTSKAVLINLENGEKITIDRQSSFEFNKGSDILLIQLAKEDPKSKAPGSDLIIVDLKSGHISRKGDVSRFSLNKSGDFLAYTIESPDSLGNGLFLFKPGAGSDLPLDTDRKIYSQLSWNEEGTALAVLKGTTPKGQKHRSNTLLSFKKLNSSPEKFEYIAEEDKDFPEGYIISENAAPSFSNDHSVYYFGISRQEKKTEKKKDADPVANVDIWHWNDERIQSVQMKQAARDRKFTFTSAVRSADKKFVMLADSTMRYLSLSRDGLSAIGRNDKPYISDWKPRMSDYYLLDVKTGERKLIRKEQERTYGYSPDSRNYLFWIDGNFWNLDIRSGDLKNITQKTGISFVNELFDRAGQAPPYGIAGWSKDGKSVLLYSRYDLWDQPLDGTAGRNLTSGYGAENEIVLRYIKTDPEEKFIDTSKPLLLSAYGYWTKDAGYYELNDSKLKKLIYTANSYGTPLKAKKADSYLFTRESPSEYPDYYISDSMFKKPGKITDANPLVSEFSWYSNKLIEYTNKDGVRLQAVLMVPDGYRKGDKYPMLVDFYEKNSQNLNRWSRIIYRDTPMFPKYASNGYLVLLPDIHFNLRTTHSDMLECIEAAVNKVHELGYVDMDRIGIHGHSFSGQGGNYIVTHSDMFAAAVIGAGVSNLVSDFNQLWKSSGTNQHNYDYYGQGRFNTNPYDDFELFVDQSAVFHARNMNTPLLLFQGVEDGSVEWLQAIEFYNGLRFNGKNVILCSYPGEDHHLARWENMLDFQTRMEQFYDHYLKGKPAPDWIIKGIPYLEKASDNN
jgi:dipeptidyl aminopeptidase/acylaminoacyl peptidase